MPRHFLLLILCILAYICGGTISMLMSVYLPSVVRDLLGNADEATMSRVGPYLNAAYLAGMTIGGLVVGYLSDRFGRVKMLAVSAVVCGVFTLAAVGAHDWIWVAAARAMAGIGVSGILLTCAVLVSERWPADGRAVAQGILGVAFPVGIVLSGGLNVLFSDWREAFSVGLAPLVVAVLVLILLRETKKEAGETESRSPLKVLLQPPNRLKLIVGAVVYGFVLVGLWAIFSWMPTWVDSLIGGGEGAGQMRGITMMMLGMGGMAGTGVSGFLVNQLGVRRTLLSNFIGTLFVCMLLFLSNNSFSPLVLVETAVLALFFGINQGALTVYVTELFPTEVRATGTGFCFNIGRVFTTSAVFFVGSLVAALGGYANAMLVFSGAFVIAWLVLFFDNCNPELRSGDIQ
ncbi:MAG: MFS transporter [Phycisphaerae bacterium]|nr:MFS transporter [Saprospiraceae bacterium]